MADVYKVSRRWWNKSNVFLNSPDEPWKWIYRVEDKEGFGPFRKDPKTFRSVLHECIPKYRRRPLLYLRPDEDFNPMLLFPIGFYRTDDSRPAFKFGFERLNQMSQWFNAEEIKKIKSFGFSIVRRKAALCLTSPHQCLYIPYDEKQTFYWRNVLLPHMKRNANK